MCLEIFNNKGWKRTLGSWKKLMYWTNCPAHHFSQTNKVHLCHLQWRLELITFEILAAERLRLMEFDNRLIIDCFANVVNILIWQFSTNDRFKSEKYESLLGKSISRNELYWALFDKYFWLIVIMWRNRLIPINCNYFCWPSDYD